MDDNKAMVKMLVCGDRRFEDYDFLSDILDEITGKLYCHYLSKGGYRLEIVSGHCEGADILGERYAREHKYWKRVFAPDWKHHGKAAGPIRNTEMADYLTDNDEDVPVVVAFVAETSKGTWDMVNKSRRRGYTVFIVDTDKRTISCELGFPLSKDGFEAPVFWRFKPHEGVEDI